jgi:hypothetical protein
MPGFQPCGGAADKFRRNRILPWCRKDLPGFFTGEKVAGQRRRDSLSPNRLGKRALQGITGNNREFSRKKIALSNIKRLASAGRPEQGISLLFCHFDAAATSAIKTIPVAHPIRRALIASLLRHLQDLRSALAVLALGCTNKIVINICCRNVGEPHDRMEVLIDSKEKNVMTPKSHLRIIPGSDPARDAMEELEADRTAALTRMYPEEVGIESVDQSIEPRPLRDVPSTVEDGKRSEAETEDTQTDTSDDGSERW